MKQIENAMEPRQQRGLMIAALSKITRKNGDWVVPSQSGNGRYTVHLDPEKPTCTCPDHETRACKCKHIFAVECVIKRERNGDGTTTVTEAVRVTAMKRTTYRQDWPAYNEAQTNEKSQFQILLRDLCTGIENPPHTKGRRPLPLSDAVICRYVQDLFNVLRSPVYQRSERCTRQGLHFGSAAFQYHLQLFGKSSAESDSDGFDYPEQSAVKIGRIGFCRGFHRFHHFPFCARGIDHKYGVVRQEHDWVKCHLMCGVKTNVVTAVEIHERDASDTKILPSLVETTSKNFKMAEISADKGYSWH